MGSPDKTELWIAIGLFIFSELIGLSKAKDNSVIQLVLRLLHSAFPTDLILSKRSTTLPTRDPQGKFVRRKRPREQ